MPTVEFGHGVVNRLRVDVEHLGIESLLQLYCHLVEAINLPVIFVSWSDIAVGRYVSSRIIAMMLPELPNFTY